jgi:hypothetical protein
MTASATAPKAVDPKGWWEDRLREHAHRRRINNAAVQRYKNKHKALGLCVDCSSPARTGPHGGRTLCQACWDTKIRYQREDARMRRELGLPSLSTEKRHRKRRQEGMATTTTTTATTATTT